MPDAAPYSKRCWFTFPSKAQVEQPIIWSMSRAFPDVTFDIRQASVQHEIGIMAVLLTGREQDVRG
ncbi:MAG TPA: NIL domain-containing protein, partial [Tepidisphaeraceae bacterium]|nr:NIL domain-containing protein [Tepidisphaeraceae bacterium]